MASQPMITFSPVPMASQCVIFAGHGRMLALTPEYLISCFTICGELGHATCAGVAEGIIMKIGGWRTRSVFERYAIVSRSDMNDAILKLQESENRVEQERLRAEAEREQIRAQIGHNGAISAQPTASKAVN